MSSWVGKGPESSTMIKLTPVESEDTINQVSMPSPQITIKPDLNKDQNQQEEESKSKESVAAVFDSNGCQEFNPMLMNVMIGITSLLVCLTISIGCYSCHVKKQYLNKKATLE